MLFVCETPFGYGVYAVVNCFWYNECYKSYWR